MCWGGEVYAPFSFTRNLRDIRLLQDSKALVTLILLVHPLTFFSKRSPGVQCVYFQHKFFPGGVQEDCVHPEEVLQGQLLLYHDNFHGTTFTVAVYILITCPDSNAAILVPIRDLGSCIGRFNLPSHTYTQKMQDSF